MKPVLVVLTAFLLIPAAFAGSGIMVGGEDALVLAERLIDETDAIYEGILADKPYHPSLFAWGMHYLARACLAMYEATSEERWLDRAIKITDYLVLYSDVNGDGIPSWGSYNDTWGISKWEFKEYTVWDGVNSLPIIEVAMLIRDRENLSRDPELAEKATAYVDLVRRVVIRHYPCWTQVAPGMGYYWDDPSEDVGPYVNGFAALAHVELLLYQATGNATYLDRPRQMAEYILHSARYDEDRDLYTWEYLIGGGEMEDISHGAIDVEFLITANRVGLIPDSEIIRICNTYQKNIWQVPNLPESRFPLAMLVDGSGDSEYTDLSRGWVRLSAYVPDILEQQRLALGAFHAGKGLGAAGFKALAVAEIPLMAARLSLEGTDPGNLQVLDLQSVTGMLNRSWGRFSEFETFGTNASVPRSLLEEASEHIDEHGLANASLPIASIWLAWDFMDSFLRASSEVGDRLEEVEEEIREAEELGIGVSHCRDALGGLLDLFRAAGSLEDLESVDLGADELEVQLQIAVAQALIALAEETVLAARQLGIDTSREEIFVTGAKEHFEKGNYISARLLTEYPLRLREQIRDPTGVAAGILLLLLLEPGRRINLRRAGFPQP